MKLSVPSWGPICLKLGGLVAVTSLLPAAFSYAGPTGHSPRHVDATITPAPKSDKERAAAPLEEVYAWNRHTLQQEREQIRQGHDTAQTNRDLKLLLSEANRILTQAPPTVVSKPASQVVVNGDPHEYTSLGPYLWPNPATSNGHPYIYRDGQINPQSTQYGDAVAINHMIKWSQILSLAYFYTGEERYADQAVKILTTWFVAPATRMKPDLKFGQVAGEDRTNSSGIIEGRGLGWIMSEWGLLEGSHAFTPEVKRDLNAWFEEYYHWLTTDRTAQTELRMTNNHGTWFDVQTLGIALGLGKQDDARQIITRVKGRMDAHIDADGKLPLELRRTRPLHYSLFELQALGYVATMAQNIGEDLWTYHTSDHADLQKAYAFLFPFISGKRKSPYPEVAPLDQDILLTTLRQYGVGLRKPEYLEFSETVNAPSSYLIRTEYPWIRAE